MREPRQFPDAPSAASQSLLSPPAPVPCIIRSIDLLSLPQSFSSPSVWRSSCPYSDPALFLLLTDMASSLLPVALQNKLLGYSRAPSTQLAAAHLDL